MDTVRGAVCRSVGGGRLEAGYQYTYSLSSFALTNARALRVHTHARERVHTQATVAACGGDLGLFFHSRKPAAAATRRLLHTGAAIAGRRSGRSAGRHGGGEGRRRRSCLGRRRRLETRRGGGGGGGGGGDTFGGVPVVGALLRPFLAD